MNVRPSGVQPKMRAGMWQGVPQSMVDEEGVAKGLERVCQREILSTPEEQSHQGGYAAGASPV